MFTTETAERLGALVSPLGPVAHTSIINGGGLEHAPLHRWYSHRRPHSRLGRRSPLDGRHEHLRHYRRSRWQCEGKLYLCATKDVFSNKIVGYSIDGNMTAELCASALDMAVSHRGNPTGVTLHSDRGSRPDSNGGSNT